MNFLTGSPQTVRPMYKHCSLLTVTSHKDNTILKFADDTVVIDLNSIYKGGGQSDTEMMNEVIEDMRKKKRPYNLLTIQEFLSFFFRSLGWRQQL